LVDNAAIHWTTTMDPLVAHRTAISRHALEIVAEIASSGLGHVTLEMVVQVLLDRYGVTDMAALRAGGVRDVPALHLLSELQRKTDAFLQAYFATRSVLAYVDAERELVDALNAFALPPLPSLAGDATAAAVAAVADPNEIDLDADVGAPAALAAADAAAAAAVRPPLPARYEDFGLGALYLHPLVAAYFPVQQHVLASAPADGVSAEGVLAAFVSARDVLAALAAADADALPAATLRSAEAAAAAEAYLCAHWDVPSLLAVGVVLQGDLALEVRTLFRVRATLTPVARRC